MQFAAGSFEIVPPARQVELPRGVKIPLGRRHVSYECHFCSSATSLWRTVRKRYSQFLALDAQVAEEARVGRWDLPANVRFASFCPARTWSKEDAVVEERQRGFPEYLSGLAAFAEDAPLVAEKLLAFLEESEDPSGTGPVKAPLLPDGLTSRAYGLVAVLAARCARLASALAPARPAGVEQPSAADTEMTVPYYLRLLTSA
jgi:hypothetical protein